MYDLNVPSPTTVLALAAAWMIGITVMAASALASSTSSSEFFSRLAIAGVSVAAAAFLLRLSVRLHRGETEVAETEPQVLISVPVHAKR